MSIKTKVILAMASLAVVITGILFFVANFVTSSSIDETINLAGITYTKAVTAAGKEYSSQIDEHGMLAALKREVSQRPDGDVAQYWQRAVVDVFQISEHFQLAHPDGGYASIDDMVDDLQWVRLAGFFEKNINPENKEDEEAEAIFAAPNNMKRVAEEVLGKNWLSYRDAIDPPVREKIGVLKGEVKDFFPLAQDLPEDVRQYAIETMDDYVTEEPNGVSKAAAERVTSVMIKLATAMRDLGEQRLADLSALNSQDPQVVGVRFEPAGVKLGFMEEIHAKSGRAQLIPDNFIINTYEGSNVGVSDPTDAGEPGYQYSTGTDKSSNRELRLYHHTGEGGKTYVFLDPIVLDEARGKTLLLIGLVTLGSLVLAVVSAFVLGGGITKPVTALMQDVSTIAAGNFQHRPNIKSRDEVGALGTLIGEMAGSLEIGQSAWRENQSRRHDIDMAREIQENLLPKDVPEIKGYDISAFYSPSKEVGGDYYDFIPIDEDHLGIICADVSGKGIPGSMVMMMTKALITYVAQGNPSPKDVFCRVNKIVAKDIKRGMFVTAYYAVLNTKTREMRVVSAGHNPMVLYRAAQGVCEEVNPGGIALGFDKDGKLFERNMQEQVIKLGRGDRVVIYTDGIIEANDPDEQPYGIEALKGLTQEMAGAESPDYLQELVAELDAHTQGGPQQDDITVVSLRAV